jgi:hypothetical protein
VCVCVCVWVVWESFTLRSAVSAICDTLDPARDDSRGAKRPEPQNCMKVNTKHRSVAGLPTGKEPGTH